MNQPLASFQISNSFQNLLDTVFHSIPKILVFLVILVIGWIVAKALGRIVDMILRRVKFDRFVERGVVGQALARSNTDATTLISKIVYYAILLVTLQMAFGVWGPNPISTMLDAVVGWLPKAIVAIIIIVIASAIARVVKDLINGAIGGLSYGPFLASVAVDHHHRARRHRGAQPGGHRRRDHPADPLHGAAHRGRGRRDRRRRRPDQADAGALGADAVRGRAGDQHPDRLLPAGPQRRDARTAARPPAPGRAAAHLPGRPGSAGYPQGAQGSGPGYPEGPGSGYQQGPQGSGNPQGTDPGDWRDPGTNLPVTDPRYSSHHQNGCG